MAAPLVTITFGGKTFKCTKRTADHLRWTKWRLRMRYPLAKLVVIQPCYNDTIEASAGTHDYDAVFDVRILRMPGRTTEQKWLKAQGFLRACGWAAWWRHTGTWAPIGNWHIHMASIPPGLRSNPTPDEIGRSYVKLGTKVGKFIDGGLSTHGSTVASSQIDDYYAHSVGLAGQHRAGADHTWFPPDINKTVFKQVK